jgi:hypothetical protein
MHYVAVPPDRDPEPVRSFKTFTSDLERLADWLVACGVKTVAMEATGVYWIPIYEILEARGLEVLLVNARHVKNVPGRKSDVTDCEWLQELHSVGLLRGSFRPVAEIAALRSYLRHRETLIQSAATTINRMQKALTQMNLQLHVVISDITGATGLRILRDIVNGQTNPQHLAMHRDARCQASEAEIAAALTGHYRPEHLFALRQNLELYDAFQRQIESCDTQIEGHLKALAASAVTPEAPLPAARSRGKRQGNEPHFDVRTPLHQISGADLSQLEAHPGARQQGFWWPSAQLPDTAFSQSCRGRPPHGRREPRPYPDRPRGLLSPPGVSHREGQGRYRNRTQARHPRLQNPEGRSRVPGSRGGLLRSAPPRVRRPTTPPACRSPRIQPRQRPNG